MVAKDSMYISLRGPEVDNPMPTERVKEDELDAIIQVMAVSKQFEEREVLDTVDLTVNKGELVAILGPTGCGKSTLLNIVAGFETPSAGYVSVNGKHVTSPNQDCAYVFQDANLFPWMRISENVAFGIKHGRLAQNRKRSRKEVAAEVGDLLKRLGIGDAASLYPYQVSGGMKARAAFGRALMANTSVMLLDEPFGALDALTRASLHRWVLKEIVGYKDKSVLLITHDVEEAILLASRIYLMSPGPGRITKEIVVPFTWPREYDNVLGSPLLADMRREILLTLLPLL